MSLDRLVEYYRELIPLEPHTSAVTSVSRNNSTTNYFSNRGEAVEYVDARLKCLRPGSQLTTIMSQEKSGVYCVRTAIATLSVGSETLKSSSGLDVT